MEKVGKNLQKYALADNKTVDQFLAELLQDSEIADFIQSHGLSQIEIKRSLPKFNQFINERRKYQNQSEQYIAKGYEPILVMNEGYADVSYLETKDLKDKQAEQAVRERIHLVNLPKTYRLVTFDAVDLDDVKRLDVFELLVDFVSQYPKKTSQQGLYLYGDMGVGKSFMMAALAHELSQKKAAATTILHYPSFAIDIKNAIKSNAVKEAVDQIKQVQVLVLDDIGAEQASSWLRDEVLQVILQHRMIEELPTFFTSNYSLSDLEKRLSQVRGENETWQAKRIMERIRFLAKEMHLEGENRRH